MMAYPAIFALFLRILCREELVISKILVARSMVSEQKIMWATGINVKINKSSSIPSSYLISSSTVIVS